VDNIGQLKAMDHAYWKYDKDTVVFAFELLYNLFVGNDLDGGEEWSR
jgi:hypothetical protein